MPHNEIPSAFLIRALARHESHRCDRCLHRMFVKGPSGLCPHCLSDRPVRPLEDAGLRSSEGLPFAPRLEVAAGWERLPIRARFRALVQRARRAEPNPSSI